MRYHQASWDDWLNAYQDVLAAVPDAPEVACPRCGSPTLRLVFVGPAGSGVGYASLWCETCVVGISISRCPVPDGATFIPIDRLREPGIGAPPNYTLVPPD
ncbi:hypothetical protein ACWEQL_32945 [Kitasatospora sp. NPDC004240]